MADVDLVTLVVDDRDAAIDLYVGRLGFDLEQDEAYGDGGRWVEVRPPGSDSTLAMKTSGAFEGEEREHRRVLIGASPQVRFRVDDCEGHHGRSPPRAPPSTTNRRRCRGGPA